MLCLPLFRNVYWSEQISRLAVTEVDSLKTLDVIPNQRISPPTLTEVLAEPPRFESIGRLAIPSLELDLPIFAGLDQTEMIYGAGTMYPGRDPQKGNLVLVGHHTGSASLLFGRLAQIQITAPIYIRYLGTNYAYQVTDMKVVKATDVAVIEETKEAQLILVTCDRITPTNDRIIVTAKRLIETNKETIAQKIKHQQRLNAEKSGWRQEWPALSMVIVGLLVTTYLIIKKV